MLKSILPILVCPRCNSNFILNIFRDDEKRVNEGELICTSPSCKAKYNIKDGFIDLTVFKFESEKEVAKSFGFEWGSHHKGLIEEKKVFGRTIEEDLNMFFEVSCLLPQELHDKIILDVGCGSAKLTKALSRYNPKFVIGTDINEATLLSHKYCQDNDKFQIIRADIFNLPIDDEMIDIGWANGVLHHTPNPREAFRSLSLKIKLGGCLSIWVYKKGFYPFRFVKDIFKLVHLDRVQYSTLFRISKSISVFSLILHFVYRIIFSIPIKVFASRGGRLYRTLRFRSYEEFLMTWFDALSPSYDSRHTRKEVESWFSECGFSQLKFWDNQIGMSGIKTRRVSASNFL